MVNADQGHARAFPATARLRPGAPGSRVALRLNRACPRLALGHGTPAWSWREALYVYCASRSEEAR
jgi:hypothetical protein